MLWNITFSLHMKGFPDCTRGRRAIFSLLSHHAVYCVCALSAPHLTSLMPWVEMENVTEPPCWDLPSQSSSSDESNKTTSTIVQTFGQGHIHRSQQRNSNKARSRAEAPIQRCRPSCESRGQAQGCIQSPRRLVRKSQECFRERSWTGGVQKRRCQTGTRTCGEHEYWCNARGCYGWQCQATHQCCD